MHGRQSEAKRNNPKEKAKVLSGAWESTCKMRARKEKKLVSSCKIMGPQKQSVRLFEVQA
jgi:hypothetical protein